MNLNTRFSEDDLNKIKEAVNKAEDKISGEIVPVIVERSNDYTSANYKSALAASALAFVVVILLDRYAFTQTSLAFFYDPAFIFIIVAAVGLVAFLLPDALVGFKRWLVSPEEMAFRAKSRASLTFLQEEVFNTKQRTGIMIFISFFEHQVIVMADKGISKVVDQSQWDKIVAELIQHIKSDKLIDGMANAIEKCGALLLEKGFVKTEDDINELGDDLRINDSKK